MFSFVNTFYVFISNKVCYNKVMTSLLKNKANLKASFSERAGLVGYSDKEILDAVKASQKVVAAGKVTPAKKAYANFKARRGTLYAKVPSASLKTR